jgi:hypothetical protein
MAAPRSRKFVAQAFLPVMPMRTGKNACATDQLN